MLESGTYLAKRYEIQEKIGSGGMADVYKAKDTALNRLVAVKILKHEYSTDATFVKKFKVEAQSAAGLSHPNIVGVYDVGEEHGIYYIVMELVQGITLKNYIDMKGKLGIREALNISVQIANGLSCAHENRIIHRDIKPQNIIMSRDGKVKVTDFGIAKVADSTTVTTTAAGTVHYISPEQARGGYSDEKSDIYSLGITMYEMVTGRVPFEGETNVAVALLHIQGTMTPPRELEPSIPVSFEKIILKCTQKKPERRYASAKELIADLRKVLTHPDGEYVVLPGFVPEGSTIIMKEDELNTIKEAAAGEATKVVPADDLEKELLEEDKKSEEDDDDEEVAPALSKVMMGLGIGGFIVLVIIILYFLANIMGVFGSGSKIGVESSETETLLTETETDTETDTEETQAAVYVPDLYGMTEAQARAELRGAGLVIDVQKGTSDDVDEGEIYDQSPEADEEVESGSTVTVYISTGKETEELVDVTGMDYTEAQAKLESLGYDVDLEFENSDYVDEDIVIRTIPGPGSNVSEGDTITIYVSSGPETQTVEMPDLHGDSLDEAISEIESAGLVYSDKYYDYSDTYDEGEVMRQSINAGASVEEGTSVSVTISMGAETEEEPDEPTSYSGSVDVESPFGCDIDDGSGEAQVYDEGEVTIIVETPDGSSQTIYDSECSDDSLPSSLDVSSDASGTGTAYFYINGIQYDSQTVYFE